MYVGGKESSTNVLTNSSFLCDSGLYVAGRGTAYDKEALKTYDGYSYAIPLCRVERRNNEGYAQDNPNGGRDYISPSLVASFVCDSNQCVLASELDSKIVVGDTFATGAVSGTSTITKIDGYLTGDIIHFDRNAGMTTDSTVYFYSTSDRPNSKFANIVYIDGITDLRHDISMTGVNYETLLQKSMKDALSGNLAKVKMKKQYYGIKKTPTDANTVFHASFDGTIEAEVGGMPHTDTLTTKKYKPSWTGLALETYSASSSRGLFWYMELCNSKEISVEFDIYNDKLAGMGTSDYFIKLSNVADPAQYLAFGVHKNGLLRMRSYSGTICYLPYTELEEGMHRYKVERGNMFVDGKPVKYGGKTNVLEDGYYPDCTLDRTYVVANSAYHSRLVSNINISKVESGEAGIQLPQDFIDGEAEIKPSFTGQRQSFGEPLSGQATVGIVRAEEINAVDLDIVLPNGVKNSEEGSQYIERVDSVELVGTEDWLFEETDGATYTCCTVTKESLNIDALKSGATILLTDDIDFSSEITGVGRVGIGAGVIYLYVPYIVGTVQDVVDYITLHHGVLKVQSGNIKTYHKDSLKASRGLTKSQVTDGVWASGDIIKVRGEAGEIISGVIDIDTASAKVIEYDGASAICIVDSVNGIEINDVFNVLKSNGILGWSNKTVIGIDVDRKELTFDKQLSTQKSPLYLVESTVFSSVPLTNFIDNGKTKTSVIGIWSGLGTNEAIFTLGNNATLTNEDIQIDYSLNSPEHQGQIPVYEEVLEATANGNKLVKSDTLTITDDFKGKISGSLFENPNKFKLVWQVETADLSFGTEYNEYNLIEELNGVLTNTHTVGVGSKPQQLYAFNLIRIVEDKYGEIPAVDKVQWLRDNVEKFEFHHYGFGVCPAGNSLTIQCWLGSNPQWNATKSIHTESIVTDSWYSTNSATAYLDDKGSIHFVVYTDASDGVTVARLHTDYVKIQVDLKWDINFSLLTPENTRRDAGRSNVLLVRKETREIKTMFPSSNEDEISIVGNVREAYDQLEENEEVTILTQNPFFIATDLNSANGEKYDTHHFNNLAWRFDFDDINVLGEFGYGEVPITADSKGINTGKEIIIGSSGFIELYATQYSLPTIDKPMLGLCGHIVMKDSELYLLVIGHYAINGDLELINASDHKGFLIPLKGRPLVKEPKGERRVATETTPKAWRTSPGTLLL